ncbi:MAG: hypothetical protein LAP13_04170 [Acidobacteriia bacterium]|nr:hypothetical protein [Terriglobia bacterium]
MIGFLVMSALVSWGKKPKTPVYRNTAPGVAFTGSKSCATAGCHEQICEDFKSVPMGNSMTPANTPAELARVPNTITVYTKKLNRYFQVAREGSDLYQTEYALDANGNRVFSTTQKLDYRTGGPLTGYTYVIRLGNWMFEAPLSYYVRNHQWELSPGYDAMDFAFSRPVLTGCLACHNGQPEAVPGRDGMYRDPPFRFMDYAVGCECCHGPGQLHVDEMTRNPKLRRRKFDDSIVNPADLSPRLADDICMNCHQGGNTRVLQPGKNYLDFRPGTPLYETVAIFKIPVTEAQRAELDRSENLPPVRSGPAMPLWWKNSNMEMSRCFHDSNGQLRCITCHVIHMRPAEQEKVAFFRERCLTCHTNESCKLPLENRMKQTPANDCVGCHMPRKPTAGIPHSNDTNHRIVRRPGQPYPDYAFDHPSPDVPGLACINRRGKDAARPIPPLTKLLAYAEVSQKQPSLSRYYYDLLEQLKQSSPDEPAVLCALGQKALAGKDDAKAVEYLTRALQKGGDYATTYADLGEALAQMGRVEESARILEKGAAIWPFSRDIQKSLVLRYLTLKQFPQAHDALKRYVALFPEDTFMQEALAKFEGRNP